MFEYKIKDILPFLTLVDLYCVLHATKNVHIKQSCAQTSVVMSTETLEALNMI